MHSRAPVFAKLSRIEKPDWNVSRMDGNTVRWPAREIWIRRGSANGGSSGSGPSGWKLRRSKVLARALAERTHGKNKK